MRDFVILRFEIQIATNNANCGSTRCATDERERETRARTRKEIELRYWTWRAYVVLSRARHFTKFFFCFRLSRYLVTVEFKEKLY